MSEPFLGEIKMFGGNFAPRGYATCDGQLLAISQNNALFALLGTIYGGDGRPSGARRCASSNTMAPGPTPKPAMTAPGRARPRSPD